MFVQPGDGFLPRSRDAVVIVPGIMGSELIDSNGRTLWGLDDPRWYVSAWTSGASLRALELSEDERAGKYNRVHASRLLRFPAFAPFLSGLEPYSALLKASRSICYRAAVTEFPYDWRLPVAHTGALLARFAIEHLSTWRGSAEEVAARKTDPDGDQPARLVLIGHSMGGLLIRYACSTPGLAEEVRATLTLGTPFFGAPKAVLMLANPRGYPLPRTRLQQLAVRMPGLYDLLPSYRCVTDDIEPRRLTASDVADVGGDAELAATSLEWQSSMSAVKMPGHEQVVGVRQPTVQAISINDGSVTGHPFTYEQTAEGVQRTTLDGDGTVPAIAARLSERSEVPFAQSHGALASQSDVMVVVQQLLTGRRRGPWLGIGQLGLDVPDVVQAGQTWEAMITGAGHTTDVSCSVVDLAAGLPVDTPTVMYSKVDSCLVARVQGQPPGLFRVRIDGGGNSPVQQIVMSADVGTAVPSGPHG